MACKYNQTFQVSNDFPKIYHDFLQSIIKAKPTDIIDYAAYYFESKNAAKEFIYIEPANRVKETIVKEVIDDKPKEEEPVILDGPIEDYEKTALMMQKKFRATKLVKAKKGEKTQK